ncbi:ATP-binding protein [Alicyclobacillus curvatus]|nr:ATP-binding protein [Alicyclobacillus curvatus]
MSLDKGIKEEFAKFVEEPSRDKLKNILQGTLGEEDFLDFKEQWIDKSSKLARHILALANSGGGCVVFGVKQLHDGTILAEGIDELKDKAKIHDGVSKFLPDTLDYHVYDFQYQDSDYATIIGRKFQVLLVESDSQHQPYLCKHDGDGLHSGFIYIRQGTESVIANHEVVQKIINKRLETGYSTAAEVSLAEHLEQLKLLYKQINQNLHPLLEMEALFLKPKPNPRYPVEDYEGFVLRAIDLKKKIIERLLGV